MKPSHLAVAVALPALLFATAPVAAQTQPGANAPQAAPAEQPRQKLTKEKFEAFIAAAVEVSQLGQIWKPKIDAAANAQEAEKLRAEARAEMTAAIEAAPGITPAEYLGIGRAARENPQLRQAIIDAVGARINAAPSGG